MRVEKISKRKIAFKKLAENRVTKALHMHQLISNLANKTNYEYSEAEANKIILALENSVKVVKEKFRNSKQGEINSFKLD